MLNINYNLLFKGIILVFCVISFVHVFLFVLYKNVGINVDINVKKALNDEVFLRHSTERGSEKTYMDFEQSLCGKSTKEKKIRRLGRCPQYGIVTVVPGGRLGNQMWDYASVWAVARRTGLKPYIPRCIKINLEKMFEQLSVPTFGEIEHCPVNHFVKSLEAWNHTNQSITLPIYSLQAELVLTWVQDIIREFTIKKELLQKSQQILHIAVKSYALRNHTFVGVHVRRTDYIAQLKRRHKAEPADVDFYKSAMKYFERKYRNVMFIMVSDDPEWCWEKFGFKNNLYVASKYHKDSPALDMTILASCNHTVFDYGTFGEWGAILAGGETIYYNLTSHSSSTIGQILKNWHTI